MRCQKENAIHDGPNGRSRVRDVRLSSRLSADLHLAMFFTDSFKLATWERLRWCSSPSLRRVIHLLPRHFSDLEKHDKVTICMQIE